ncbi:MAG: hypothetical protein ACK5MW_03155 [Enterococcus sp.]
MNSLPSLNWRHWKNLSDQDKKAVFNKILMYFVNPLREISNVQLKNFELGGIKSRTFEVEIDGEAFVFIPGSDEVILGWDKGVQGIATNAWDQHHPQEFGPQFQQLFATYGLDTLEEWNQFVNETTSELRKVAIPAMLVQKQARPAGTIYLGTLNSVTGEFKGHVEAFEPLSQAIRGHFQLTTSFADSLRMNLPERIFEPNSYYLELAPQSDNYQVYQHLECSHTSLKKTLRKKGFTLLTEDQWEYAVGAGARRLFRWGNAVDTDDSYWGKQVREKMKQANMFGIVIDNQLNRCELLQDPTLKLAAWERADIPLLDLLPLATYYRNEQDEPLAILQPTDYLYRSAILIEVKE